MRPQVDTRSVLGSVWCCVWRGEVNDNGVSRLSLHPLGLCSPPWGLTRLATDGGQATPPRSAEHFLHPERAAECDNQTATEAHRGESFELHILRPPETKPALLARGGWCGDRWWCVFGFLMGKPPCFPSMARPGAYPRNETNRGKGTRPLREQRQPTAKSKKIPMANDRRDCRMRQSACLPHRMRGDDDGRDGW